MPARSVTPASRHGISTFLSTAMIVGGIGTAWPGLLLAAAGLVLAWIDVREFQRRNPWLFPQDDGASTPMLAPEVLRLSRWALVSIVAFAALALAGVILTGNRFTVLVPAALAGAAAVVQDRHLLRTLETLGQRRRSGAS